MIQTKTERFEMRLDQSMIDRIDEWRGEQADIPSRSEAARRLIEDGLDRQDSPVKISDGEKLILAMLRDLYNHHKVKDGEIDPDFVMEAVWGGHHWGLDWQYTGLFHNHEDKRQTVREVADILDMWDFLEGSFEELSIKEKERFAKEMEPFTDVKFLGFDGNNESEYLGILRFLTKKMDRFSRFKDRGHNSHCRVLDSYQRMYAVFEKIRPTLTGGRMTLSQIMEVLSARWADK